MQAADPNQPNPVLNAYQNFTQSTPLVTRYLLHTLVVVWVLSIFLPLDMALSNIPYFTILYFEVYRILFSPLVGNNILSLIFAIIIFYRMGKQLESQHGSTGFICLLSTISLGTNLVFVAACFLMYLFGMTFALHLDASGFWMIVLGLMVVDCMATPDQPRRLFFVNVPSKYMPLALFALFSLLGGFQFAYAIALGIGYLYTFGYLEKVKPSTHKLEQWEIQYLGFLSSKPGFITSHGATGDGSMLPLNAPDGHQQQQQGLGFGNVFNAGNGPAGQRPGGTQAAGTSTGGPGGAGGPRKDVFQGSARTLGASSGSQDQPSGFAVGRAFMGSESSSGSVTKPSQSEIQQRRLAAFGATERAASPSAPPAGISDSDVRQIAEMGYSEHDARRALQLAGGNLQEALNILTT